MLRSTEVIPVFSAKDLSLPTQEIEIHQTHFTVKTGSHAKGPRPNACLVTLAVVDIAA